MGVGYRPRTGAIFFTRNGKKLEEVVHGLKSQNFFPAIGANGPATVHVNFGQAGFVFIEANVKKWGLAPATGSLAPPPPYGSEQGSILLETGTKDGTSGSQGRQHSQSFSGSPYNTRGAANNSLHHAQHGRSRSGIVSSSHPTSPGPVRSSTDISLNQLVPSDETGQGSSSSAAYEPHNQTNRHESNPLQLHIDDSAHPPPEYASPEQSRHEDDAGSGHDTDDDNDDGRPLIRATNHGPDDRSASRQTPAADAPVRSAPSAEPPGYHDAVRQGAGSARRDSVDGAERADGASHASDETEDSR